jgi:predicted transcriptional regulator
MIMDRIVACKDISLQAKGLYSLIRELESVGEFPSVDKMCLFTNSSKYIVYNALKELRNAGMVDKVIEQTASTRGAHTVYYKLK